MIDDFIFEMPGFHIESKFALDTSFSDCLREPKLHTAMCAHRSPRAPTARCSAIALVVRDVPRKSTVRGSAGGANGAGGANICKHMRRHSFCLQCYFCSKNSHRVLVQKLDSTTRNHG